MTGQFMPQETFIRKREHQNQRESLLNFQLPPAFSRQPAFTLLISWGRELEWSCPTLSAPPSRGGSPDPAGPQLPARGRPPSPLTFLMLDLEAGWKSFLHMKLANDFPMAAAARGEPPAVRTGPAAGLPGRAGLPLPPPPPPLPRSAPPRPQRQRHGRPAASPLLRHVRGAAARRGRGPGGVRQELGPAAGRGAGGAALPRRTAPARRRAAGERPPRLPPPLRTRGPSGSLGLLAP